MAQLKMPTQNADCCAPRLPRPGKPSDACTRISTTVTHKAEHGAISPGKKAVNRCATGGQHPPSPLPLVSPCGWSFRSPHQHHADQVINLGTGYLLWTSKNMQVNQQSPFPGEPCAVVFSLPKCPCAGLTSEISGCKKHPEPAGCHMELGQVTIPASRPASGPVATASLSVGHPWCHQRGVGIPDTLPLPWL